MERQSAIPRPATKLPVFKAKSSQPAPPAQQPDATANPPIPAPRSNIGTPKVAKRPSSIAAPRSTQLPGREAAAPARPVAARTNIPNGPKHSPKASTGSTVSSRAKVPKRQISTSSTRHALSNEDGELKDQLSSLEAFRSASRQESRQGFRSASSEQNADEATVETFEYVDPSREIVQANQARKVSRPSLSDRTIESLERLPSTPNERRRSSFFNPVESPMGPPARPASSMSRNSSRSNGRPGTSDGTSAKPFGRTRSPAKKAPASAQPSTRTTSRLPSVRSTTSSRRTTSSSFASRLQNAKPPGSQAISSTSKRSEVDTKDEPPKVSKSRPVLGDESLPTALVDESAAETMETKRVVSNSSAALRQQIAAAKAAARKEKTAKHDSPVDSTSATGDVPFDFEAHSDPFNQGPRDEKHILRNRINTARVDGKLNIAAMGLKQIPDEVRSMYDSASMEKCNLSWAEVVDLTRLIAADNEFESLDEAVFPDKTAAELDEDDHTEGNQFGGLELLDLHGNSLRTLPLGLRRLERLTNLNLAHNKLDNTAVDVISEIKSLKELRLGHNGLTGNVPAAICELTQLEVLDLQDNRLLGLPEALRELVSLRVLNVSGNQLTALPMEALQHLPLHELDASSNALIASLFPLGGPDGHPTLRTINVANNSLAALTFLEPLHLPQLRLLDVTNNHMTVLPAVDGWNELITLLVGDNKISEFPVGFASLQKLRNANFTSNGIRLVEAQIANMAALESLILASNPLREKKFLTMNAADIKRDLKARLAPAQDEHSANLEEPGSPVTVIGDSEVSSSMWCLKGKHMLDLASRDVSDDINGTLGSFLDCHEVRQIQLQGNRLTCVPPALWIAQDLRVLDLSNNVLSADYLSDELQLPALQELNLSKCRLTSFEPLISQLVAPNLSSLNVSANRISGALPKLRQSYPGLATLLASDNRITSVDAAALQGMHTVNLTSNDIEALPAEIGLLWEKGLRSFEVGSNAFRVPNYRILEKGTEALLRWLRDKVPASHGANEPQIA